MDTKDPRVGVVVGRFQIDKLHDGHMRLLTYVSVTHDRMLVLIGVRPAEASDTNPLDFLDRYEMIHEAFPTALILPMVDRGNDEVWSRHVDSLINSTYGYGVDAVFYVGRDSFKEHYLGKFPIEEHDFGVSQLEARDIRNEIKGRRLTTAEGRAGAIKAIMNQPHRTTMMVDMFMIRKKARVNKSDPEDFEILMGKKADEDLWRLPGGRVDPKESFAHAAAREMLEETGMATSSGLRDWKYITDYNVPDWRCRDTDQISYKTVLMTAEYFSGAAKGDDDLPEVAWIPSKELATKSLRDQKVVQEHVVLVGAGIAHTLDNPPSFVTSEPEEKEDD